MEKKVIDQFVKDQLEKWKRSEAEKERFSGVEDFISSLIYSWSLAGWPYKLG